MRGSAQAEQGATTGLAQNNALFNQAGSLYSTLAPQLRTQAENPQGFGPANLARIRTENEQSAGGANAGAVGQAGLEESRTRNAGGLGMALTRAARGAGEQLSDANLKTNIANEGLKEQQREGALRGEEGLYGTGLSGGEAALGAVAPNVNADAQAKEASWGWASHILGPILGAAGGAAGGYLSRKP